MGSVLCLMMVVASTSMGAQGGAETFTATATVKAAGGATTTGTLTMVVERKMSQAEVDRLMGAFQTGGPAALRKALTGVPPTGSVRLGNAPPTPTRLTLERITDKGRLLTIVTDQPLLFLGAGLPGAKAKEGYEFAVIDIEVDAKGSGEGTVAPAAKVILKNGAVIVDDYASEGVRLVDVRKVK